MSVQRAFRFMVAAAMTVGLLVTSAQADECTGTVIWNYGDGGAQTKGAKFLEIRSQGKQQPICIAFDDVAEEILRTCPIGSRCRIDADVPGDAGIHKIHSIKRK